MPLTPQQIDYIKELDSKGRQIMAQGGEEALLMSLCHKMQDIKTLMDGATKDELNAYCQQYDGFYQYMHLLERLAPGCADGIFDDLKVAP